MYTGEPPGGGWGRPAASTVPVFPADVADALAAAGWGPGYQADQAIGPWLERCLAVRSHSGAVHRPVEAALRALTRFGGVRVEPPGGFGFALHPGPAIPDPGTLTRLADLLGSALFPLGRYHDGPADLAMDEAGRVFLLHPAGDFFVGGRMEDALANLVRGVDLLLVGADGTWCP